MLVITGVDKGDIVPIMISIAYGSKVLGQKLTSNTELTRSHNVKNLLQHTTLNINLRQSRLLHATSGSISLRKTVTLSVVIPHRKTDGSPLESEPAICKRKPRSGLNKEITRRGEIE